MSAADKTKMIGLLSVLPAAAVIIGAMFAFGGDRNRLQNTEFRVDKLEQKQEKIDDKLQEIDKKVQRLLDLTDPQPRRQ